MARNHDRNARLHREIAHLERHSETLGDRAEGGAQVVHVRGCALGRRRLKGNAHEEPARIGVTELGAVDDVHAALEQEACDGMHDPDRVLTRQGKHEIGAVRSGT